MGEYSIVIKKSRVTTHAAVAIRKALDVRSLTGTLPGYHLEPDSSEGMDVELLNRCMELRDAKVRTLMNKYLSEHPTTADDELMENTPNFIYALSMPESWPGSLLKPLATFIHNYLVCGILYDYLKDKMAEMAEAYLPDVAAMEEQLEETLSERTGMFKTPMQPF